MMKTIKIFSIVLLLSGSLDNILGQSTFVLIESTTPGCGPQTACEDSIICFRIMITPEFTSHILSYNIWVNFPGSGLTFLSDAACITNDGTDNDEFLPLGNYRVSGVSGDSLVQAGVQIALHSVCFTYEDLGAIDGQSISVGGSLFGLLSTLTYEDPNESEPDISEFPFTMNSSSVSCLEVLSVHLLSFEARRNGQTAILDWFTTDEQDNVGFEIERSIDGISFEIIGIVEADGQCRTQCPYTFIDVGPKNGINYYRLKYADKDGSHTYSAIRSVLFTNDDFHVRTWPNPTVDKLHIEIQSALDAFVEIKLLTISGQEVLYRKLPSGYIQERLNVNDLQPGVYHLIVESVFGTHVDKIVILD